MRILVTTLVCSFILASPVAGQRSYDAFIAGLEVSEDISLLPDAVRVKREALIAAAVSGDAANFAAVVANQPIAVQISALSDDPEAALLENATDSNGRQMLGMLRNLLDLPFAIHNTGNGAVRYTWPYLQHVDFSTATPSVEVDSYRVLAPDMVEQALEIGFWLGWRVVIDENGNLIEFMQGGG